MVQRKRTKYPWIYYTPQGVKTIRHNCTFYSGFIMSTTRCLNPDNPNRKTGNLPPLYFVYYGGKRLKLNISCLYIYNIIVSIKLFINVIISKGNYIIGSNISIKYLFSLITCSLSYLFNNNYTYQVLLGL